MRSVHGCTVFDHLAVHGVHGCTMFYGCTMLAAAHFGWLANVWRNVYGSEVVRGEEVVLCGLAQIMLNGCQGVVREWNADRDRWVIVIPALRRQAE